MTNEQREAIELLEGIRDNTWTTKYIMSSDSKKADTVLSLIKEQQEEMQQKDKQIDLMADFMYKTGTGRRALSCMFRQNDECNENGCRYCIKQYFADKAKIEQ